MTKDFIGCGDIICCLVPDRLELEKFNYGKLFFLSTEFQADINLLDNECKKKTLLLRRLAKKNCFLI